VWSCEFVTDRAEDGRQLRLLVVIDKYARGCLAIEVGRSFTAQDVVGVLQYLFAVRGTPGHIRSDNKSQGGQAQTPPITLQAFESEPIRAPQAAWDVHLGWAAEIENSIGIKLRKGALRQAMRTK
jgi:hypothetical protein